LKVLSPAILQALETETSASYAVNIADDPEPHKMHRRLQHGGNKKMLTKKRLKMCGGQID